MYKIVRFCFDDNDPDHHKVIKTGLTLEEAQDHCQRDDTREQGVWFDGYYQEDLRVSRQVGQSGLREAQASLFFASNIYLVRE